MIDCGVVCGCGLELPRIDSVPYRVAIGNINSGAFSGRSLPDPGRERYKKCAKSLLTSDPRRKFHTSAIGLMIENHSPTKPADF
jgi:hypothetical protein